MLVFRSAVLIWYVVFCSVGLVLCQEGNESDVRKVANITPAQHSIAHQEFRAERPQQPYWDRTNKSLFVWNFVAQTLDATTTRYFLDNHLTAEGNPLARPWENRGVAGTIALHFGFNLIATQFMSYELHKHGHPKMAKTLVAFTAAESTYAGVGNARFIAGYAPIHLQCVSNPYSGKPFCTPIKP